MKKLVKSNFDDIVNDIGDVIALVKSMFSDHVDVTIILTSRKPGEHNCVMTTADSIGEVLAEIEKASEITASELVRESDVTKH